MMPWLGNPQLGKHGVKEEWFECSLINKLATEISGILGIVQILNHMCCVHISTERWTRYIGWAAGHRV